MDWKDTYRSVVGPLPKSLYAAVEATGCTMRTAMNWAEGRTLMSAAKWKAIVVYCQCEPRWRELSAARDLEAARKGKRGRKPVSPAEQLRRRAVKLNQKADELEQEETP